MHARMTVPFEYLRRLCNFISTSIVSGYKIQSKLIQFFLPLVKAPMMANLLSQ